MIQYYHIFITKKTTSENDSEIFPISYFLLPTFRQEKKTILTVLSNTNAVIALGGGAFIDLDIRNEILKSCVSFWLFMNIKNLLKRLTDTSKRPLLNSQNLEDSLSNLYEKRRKIYETAKFKIDCNNKEKSEITDEIIKLYEKN